MVKVAEDIRAGSGYTNNIPSFQHLIEHSSIHLKMERVWHNYKPSKAGHPLKITGQESTNQKQKKK